MNADTDDFDNLKDVWLSQPVWRLPNENELLQAIKQESAAFEAKTLRRDLKELFAGLALAALFSWPDSRPDGPRWAQATAIAISLLVLAVALGMRFHLRRTRWPSADTLRGELNHLLTQKRTQERLLATLTWWYLLPLAIAGALITYYHFGLTFAHWRGRDLFLTPLFVSILYCYHRYVSREVRQLQLERLLDLCAAWDRLAHGDASEWDNGRR